MMANASHSTPTERSNTVKYVTVLSAITASRITAMRCSAAYSFSRSATSLGPSRQKDNRFLSRSHCARGSKRPARGFPPPLLLTGYGAWLGEERQPRRLNRLARDELAQGFNVAHVRPV